jgi:hypothetical protein
MPVNPAIRAIGAVVALMVVVTVAGCSDTASGLSPELKAWCKANSSVTVLAKAVELGSTRAEMINLFDEVTVSGWGPVEHDQRYVRACQAAYAESR